MSGSAIRPAEPAWIAEGARLLREGELVAFPTETVYGLGAAATDPAAVARVFAAKGRPAQHPLIVHLAHIGWLERWAREIAPAARALAKRFWPGPLTLILPRSGRADDVVTGGQDGVGLRCPAHPVALALLEALGEGIAAPSANRFGHVSPTTAAHVHAELGAAVSLILDGGPCSVGIESTIVDFTSGAGVLLRPGGVSAQSLAEVLGYAPLAPGRTAPRASGTLASHYAPRTPAALVSADRLVQAAAAAQARGARPGVLARTVRAPRGFEGLWRVAGPGCEHYARALYAELRLLDAAGCDLILVETPPAQPEWHAVLDRLLRATSRNPEQG